MSDTGLSGKPDNFRTSSYLDEALNLPIEQREAWLQDLERTKPDIGAGMRRLLAAQTAERFTGFLSKPIAPGGAIPGYAAAGELIGRYRIVQELGEGGMAVVYLAERADGQYSQRVAVKFLRFGPQGSRAHGQFAQERQILASLDHPAIARLLDAGITEAGLSYLVMEYVDGVPIDRYCDEQRLSIDERLRLFLKVADAVQYAHRHLIVHRDLKPSNIVVTREGVVKLLDFGIAKLLAPGAFDHAAPPTWDGSRLMTPEYASPEQVLGEPITAATDIYQLGLLLYGLLTGRNPYAISNGNPFNAFRVICESEPTPPSTAVSRTEGADHAQGKSIADICASRATSPDRLRRTLRRDLDAILLKTLRKEPGHRYASVGWLIDDIRRYQQGLIVSAYEGALSYRAVKFIRRNAMVLAVAGFATLALAAVTAWYTVQLANERDLARREATSAQQIAGFLTSVFRGSDSRVADGSTTARALLDRGAERIDKELSGQPEIKARLLNVIGEVYVQYDLPKPAQSLLERALRLNTQLFGSESQEVAESLQALATLAGNHDDLQRAKNLFERVMRIRERTLGPRDVATADTSAALAATFMRLGDFSAAIAAAERAIDIYTDAVGTDDERTLTATNILAVAAFNSGDLVRGRKETEQLLPRIERTLGSEHRNFASALGNLGYYKTQLGDYEGAEQLIRRSLEINERLYGPDHGFVTMRWNNLGVLFLYTGRLRESIASYERAITTTQRRVGKPGDRLEGYAVMGIGYALRTRGDLEGALKRFQSALQMQRATLGVSHPDSVEPLQAWGNTHLAMGNTSVGAEALREVLSIARRVWPSDHHQHAAARIGNGWALVREGYPEKGETEIRAGLRVYERVLPPEHLVLAEARSVLGEALLAQGKIAEAESVLVSSARRLENTLSFERRLTLQRVIRLYEAKGVPASVRQYQAELADLEAKVRE